ncbi:MAG: transcriptional regulator [Piscirickettsiaceae bacterium]|nr:MAG: transcriptional regulator [Piscirickettsiaceae bacterium]PCH83265.1 MAG: transcriptional regulator [Piscirickettsiaceae bacterium]PCH84454.1 MAG: transcriptional regulator [Piscirickettsiaceae bacterium]
MAKLSLLSASDVQQSLCEWLISQRKASKLSREKLAQRSTVPASTIKKFETTGQISLRQFVLLWQTVDELKRLNDLSKLEPDVKKQPLSINEVLQ